MGQYCRLPWFQLNTLVFRKKLPVLAGSPEVTPELLSCAACGRRGCKLCCAICQKVWFCSPTCLGNSWLQHKEHCQAQSHPCQSPPASVQTDGSDGAPPANFCPSPD